MVAAHDLVQNKAVADTWEKSVRDHKIIDAPSRIVCPGVEHIAPPGILHGVGIKGAEGVGKARGQQLAELPSLLVRETGVLTV